MMMSLFIYLLYLNELPRKLLPACNHVYFPCKMYSFNIGVETDQDGDMSTLRFILVFSSVKVLAHYQN